MPSTEVSLAKNNTSIVPIQEATSGFTNESAVALIRKQEAKIQSAAKTRPSKQPEKYSRKTFSRIDSSFLATSSVVGVAGVPAMFLYDNVFFAVAGGIFGFITVIATAIVSETNYNREIYPKIFRKKFAKLDAEHQTNLRLWELKEKEYKKAESKALRKAQPALDYLNAQMNDKEFKFNGKRCNERFVLTPLPLTDYDKVLIEVSQKPSPSSLETSSLAELEDSLSQLESTINSGSLAIEQKEPANV